MARGDWAREMKKGGVQLAILQLLSEERMYGFQMIRELKDRTEGYLVLKDGTLYPALHRMEKRGYIKSEWVVEGKDKPRKYYVITPDGTKALKAAKAEWKKMVDSVGSVLGVSR